ncbi:DUF551 domain-containing protein [Enterobacter roggenkampii]|uniref:DUF551 domain-containing protein n=1 Tax=Enterobacter roggenkampii TaxID=1812935 RepID=UPI0020CE5519|nr:DUF551 domain-containing protein [Enterobacter roggenkampii]
MSNIDKQAVQAVADLKAGYTLGHADVVILNELARIALASLEAEPVAYMTYKGYLLHAADPKLSEYSEPTPLYDAPPAPVSVPAAMEMDDDFDSAFEHGKAVGWNACRAAMLQGAENAESRCSIQTAPVLDSLPKNAESRCSNAPVIPDGWVACSERMPETMVSVLVTGTWFHHAVAFWDGLSWCDLDFEPPVTHWMPLPAAPQQEVTQALAKGMERYGDAMQKLADSGD